MSRPKYESHDPVGRIAVYDNGGETIDRYTVVYIDRNQGQRRGCENPNGHKVYECLGMSDNPFHPQGFGQHGEAVLGPHLGKRISFFTLNADCRKAALQG